MKAHAWDTQNLCSQLAGQGMPMPPSSHHISWLRGNEGLQASSRQPSLGGRGWRPTRCPDCFLLDSDHCSHHGMPTRSEERTPLGPWTRVQNRNGWCEVRPLSGSGFDAVPADSGLWAFQAEGCDSEVSSVFKGALGFDALSDSTLCYSLCTSLTDDLGGDSSGSSVGAVLSAPACPRVHPGCSLSLYPAALRARGGCVLAFTIITPCR